MVAILPGSLPFMKSFMKSLSPPPEPESALTVRPRDRAMTEPEPSRRRSSEFQSLSPTSQPVCLPRRGGSMSARQQPSQAGSSPPCSQPRAS